MRTFHVGGTASQTFKQPIIKAKNEGTVRLQRPQGRGNHRRTTTLCSTRTAPSAFTPRTAASSKATTSSIGSVIAVADGATVKKGETFIQWDPYNVPIITEKAGKIEFRDMLQGVTIRKEVDEATGVMGTVVIEHKEDLHPQIVLVDDARKSSPATRSPPVRTSK